MTEATSGVPGVDDPAFIVEMFEALGIPRLRQVLDDGSLGVYVDEEELEAYCRVAAVHSSGLPISAGSGDAWTLLKDELGWMLATALSGDGPDYVEIDGEPHVRVGDGPPLAVTADRLRHWQWEWCILRDPRSAGDLLAQAPDRIRRDAEKQAGQAWSDSFETIVGGIDS